MDIIVGTAGHIDHGKTSLVKTLSGTDTDRLPEEKQRGITVDLGFAELTIGEIHFGFVDVPGHERFIKNMLAGASGIDLVLLVVAADEGIMPQTREHFDICRLLQIKNGLVAVTKKDIVDDEMLELVRTEVTEFVAGTFLDDSPIIAVSSRTGEGIDDLRDALAAAAARVTTLPDTQITRLPIDRSFAVKGFGSVVTGTLISGKIGEGDELELFPARRKLRVRGVQSHGEKVNEAHSGRRTAVNLAGIEHHDVERGMLLAEPNSVELFQIFDAEVEMLPDAKPLKTRQRVRLHIGTAEILARVAVIGGDTVAAGEKGFVQFRLESPVVTVIGERFVIRSYSPQMTIGGGSVLFPNADKLLRRNAEKQKEFLGRLAVAIDRSDTVLQLLVEHSGETGITRAKARSATGWTTEHFDRSVDRLRSTGELLSVDGTCISANAFRGLQQKVLSEVERLHDADRLAPAVSIEKVRSGVLRQIPSQIENAVLTSLAAENKLSIDGDEVRLSGRGSQLSESETKALDTMREVLVDAALEVPKIEDVLAAAMASGISKDVARKLFQQLVDSGEVLRVGSDFAFSSKVINNLVEKLRSFASSVPDRSIDVAKFKEVAGVSRKYAIPLLEYFDQQKITARRGDKRLII